MSLSKGLVKNVARLHGYWIYQNFLRKSQFWPEDRRQAYVMEKLRRTLVRAYEGTAFYRERRPAIRRILRWIRGRKST